MVNKMLGNLLNQALSTLPAQKIGWRRFLGYCTNARGQEKAKHYRQQWIMGQVQPAEKADYESLSVFATKSLYSVWASLPMKNVQKMASGDLILWNGKTLEIIAIYDWHTQNGWVKATAIERESDEVHK
jgi:hypothetical protein